MKVKVSGIDNIFSTCAFYFFKMSGLATIKLINTPRKKDRISRWNTKKSKLGIVYNIFLISIVVTLSAPGLTYMIETGYLGKFQEEVMIVAVIDLSFVLCILTTLVRCCIRQKKFISIVDKVNDAFELSLAVTSDHRPPENNHPIATRLALCVVNVIIIIAGSIVVFQNNLLTVAYSFANFSWLFLNSCVFIQYSLIVESLRKLFKLINDEFCELVKPPDGRLHKTGDPVTKQLVKIDRLIQLYGLLSDVSEELSNYYSSTMLWCIFNNFLSLFISLYCNIKRLIISKGSISSFEFVSDFEGIYFHSIPLPTLTISVSNTVNEVNFCISLVF